MQVLFNDWDLKVNYFLSGMGMMIRYPCFVGG